MDKKVIKAINKFAMTIGVVISLHCLELNIITIMILSICLVLVAAKLFGQPIKEAVEQGVLTKDELTSMFLKSPYPWLGLTLVIVSTIYHGLSG